MTDFKDILIKYMEELDCSSKELADSSGLSAATISRYRSGERIPDVESDNLKQLIYILIFCVFYRIYRLIFLFCRQI